MKKKKKIQKRKIKRADNKKNEDGKLTIKLGQLVWEAIRTVWRSDDDTQDESYEFLSLAMLAQGLDFHSFDDLCFFFYRLGMGYLKKYRTAPKVLIDLIHVMDRRGMAPLV